MKNILIIYCLCFFTAFTGTAQEVHIPVSKQQQAVTDLTQLLGKDRSAVEKQLGKSTIDDLKIMIIMEYPDKGIKVILRENDEKEIVVFDIILMHKKKKVGRKEIKYKAWKYKFSLDDLEQWYGQYDVKSDYRSTYEHPDFSITFNCKPYRANLDDDEIVIKPSPSYNKRPERTPEQIASQKKAEEAYTAILAIAKDNENKASNELFEQAKVNNKTTNAFIAYMSMHDGKIIEGYQLYLYNNNKIWLVKGGKNIGGYLEVKMFSDEIGDDKMRRLRYYILENGKETSYEFAIINTKNASHYPFLLFFGEGDFFIRFRGK